MSQARDIERIDIEKDKIRTMDTGYLEEPAA
jgi:hypothetical protein